MAPKKRNETKQGPAPAPILKNGKTTDTPKTKGKSSKGFFPTKTKEPQPVPPPAEERRPSGLFNNCKYWCSDCLERTKLVLMNAYETVKEKIITTDSGSLMGMVSTRRRHSDRYGKSFKTKYHEEVLKAVEVGDFRKISAALEKYHGDRLFETRLALNAVSKGHKLDDIDHAIDQLDKHGLQSYNIDVMRQDAAIKRLKRDLQGALTSKNLNLLDCFVWDAFNERMRQDLGQLLDDAINLRNRLNRLRCIRNSVLHMDDTALFSIFNDSNPHLAVQDTMTAVYLLLVKSTGNGGMCACVTGSDDTDTTWPHIQKFMRNKDPSKSLKVLLSKFCGDVARDYKLRAQRLVDVHDHKTVYEANQYVIYFFIWVNAMLREMETQSAPALSRIFANM